MSNTNKDILNIDGLARATTMLRKLNEHYTKINTPFIRASEDDKSKYYKEADEWFAYLINNLSSDLSIALIYVALAIFEMSFNNTNMPHHKKFFEINMHRFNKITEVNND